MQKLNEDQIVNVIWGAALMGGGGGGSKIWGETMLQAYKDAHP